MVIKLEFVPKNNYYAVKDHEIIMIGENPRELAQKIMDAGVESPVIIKFNGILEERSEMESLVLNKVITTQSLKEKYLNSI